MKVVAPKPFTFEAGRRAVLLLHGFTGNANDVRMLGRFLQTKGYTCHGPQYVGHGAPPEKLVQTVPEEWWKDVVEGYQYLKQQGYDEIAVAGLSLGGLFSLKLGYTEAVKGIVSMCAPMYIKSDEIMLQGIEQFAKEYKKREGKTATVIEEEMKLLEKAPQKLLHELQGLISEVRDNVDLIYNPLFVVQARKDEMINVDSANIIFEEAESDMKEIKWYEQSGHAITLDKEREQLHEDVYQFLEKLDWKE
ncbi:alpha/beta hydrolase [Bacillus solimangrovi]|uniref:Carboxylesterase n=1 Tax=Bacillus solimangrovi TaxID=1305675 RepID=A0A1E5LDW4_9BACI|nr:carboxylesterase [Bacillus solimangrovi]OEH92263.1 carboxylesterase [Bacillus solimangrovi]